MSLLSVSLLGPDLMSLWMDFGVGGMRGPFWILESSIHYADSNRSSSLPTTYVKDENKKRRMYEQRVHEVEYASFVPIVLSATGGMARQASVFYKCLASLLASKRDLPYSTTVNWLRSITSLLIRSAIQCVRGALLSFHRPDYHAHIDLVVSQSHLM